MKGLYVWAAVMSLCFLGACLTAGSLANNVEQLQQQVSAEHERVTQVRIEIIKLQHQDVTAAVPVPTSHCTLHDIYVQNPGC